MVRCPLTYCRSGYDAGPTAPGIPEWSPIQELTGIVYNVVAEVFFCTNFTTNTNPTSIGTTKATPTATALVPISDGVKIWVALGCSKGSFPHYFNTSSGVRQASDIGWESLLYWEFFVRPY